jgi:hypothetical protein
METLREPSVLGEKSTCKTRFDSNYKKLMKRPFWRHQLQPKWGHNQLRPNSESKDIKYRSRCTFMKAPAFQSRKTNQATLILRLVISRRIQAQAPITCVTSRPRKKRRSLWIREGRKLKRIRSLRGLCLWTRICKGQEECLVLDNMVRSHWKPYLEMLKWS